MNKFIVPGLVAIVFVTGCGYKGPLVMPDKPAAKKAPIGKVSTEKPAAEKSEKRKTP
ncbi:MAG: lipoprotein [Acidiferrobacterales bacterium]